MANGFRLNNPLGGLSQEFSPAAFLPQAPQPLPQAPQSQMPQMPAQPQAQAQPDVQQSKGAWRKFLDDVQRDPDALAFLIQMGTGMMQPVPVGQSPAGHVGAALQSSVQGAQARKGARAKQATERIAAETAAQREERLAQTAEGQLDVSRQKLGVEKQKLGLEEQKLQSISKLREAQAGLARAQAATAGQGGTQERFARSVAAALQAGNPELAPNEAFLQAVQMLESSESPKDFERKMFQAAATFLPVATQEEFDQFTGFVEAAANRMFGQPETSVGRPTPAAAGLAPGGSVKRSEIPADAKIGRNKEGKEFAQINGKWVPIKD